MEPRPLVRFLSYVVLLDLFALVLAGQVPPPTPLVAAVTVGPMLLVSPVIAYWAVYVRGRDRSTSDGDG